MPYAQIVSSGLYVPDIVLTNDEMDARFGPGTGAWLVENVGVHERRIMRDDQVTSDLAVAAAQQALQAAGRGPQDVDLIVLATDTPDFISPGTSSAVQYKLGAARAATFDVNCACAAWITGLDIAARYIATDPDYRHVLVIGAYGMSRYINPQHRGTATLFADGAGAVLLAAGEQPGFLGGRLIADGQYYGHMGIYVGGTQQPAGPGTAQYVETPKRYPPEVNSSAWPQLVRDLMQKINRPVADINHIYFTQININTIHQVMAELELPPERTHTIMHKWGYTGSACLPMALGDAVQQGRGPQPGELVVFCGSGSGYAMGAAAFVWV